MRFWWVNQKQTFRHEIGDGYMWSPKRQQDGNKHFSYEYMKHIQPGDVIYSYAKAEIIAFGIATTYCYSYPKPVEFGASGSNWSNEGWKVDVNYQLLTPPVRTMNHIDALRSFLPNKKSPIRPVDGKGNQAYLFEIDMSLALALAKLIDQRYVDIINSNTAAEPIVNTETIDSHINIWEEKIESDIHSSSDIQSTEKETLVKARRGQGKYRELLLQVESKCRITGVDKPEHLIASHIKPWRSSDNRERIDPNNGFMLTPTIDHLFDKGFIGFENDGTILLADVANRDAMERMGVIGATVPTNIGSLNTDQKHYLDWHRDSILLK